MHSSDTSNTEPHIPRISLLAEHLIDQIKAGEVIESPANMAKELIENALDAKASKITIKIKNDPLGYFSITDNGHGIHPEDLPLVFARHATSKIHDYNDIYELQSYGFRGEALASLGSIAKVQIKSKIQHHSWHYLSHHYGVSENIQKTSENSTLTGTEITVTNLFANTPARLKFIQNKLTELQKFRRIIHAYIIAYPEITWDFHEDQEFFRYQAGDLEARKNNLLSPNLSEKVLEYKNAKVTLWIDLNPQKKRNNLHQFIYVNRRPINFSILHSIIIKHLNASPSYAVFIETVQSNLDVNVHPAKTEVKFLDKATILSLLSTLLKSLAPAHVPTTHSHESFIQSPSNHNNLNQDIDSILQNTLFDHFILLKSENKIHAGLRVDWLITYLLEVTQKDSSPEEVSILISKPIQHMLNTESLRVIQYWEQFGLKIDQSEKNYFLIRALPKGWIYTNFELLISFLIDRDSNKTHYRFVDLLNSTSLSMLLDFLNIQKLETLKIIQPLDKLNIHEK